MAILEIVDNAGGVMLYADMMAQLSPVHHRYVPMALRQLRSENLLLKQNRVVEGDVRFEVFRPESRPGL